MKKSAATFKSIFSFLPIPVCVIKNFSQNIELMNDSFCKLTGYSQEKICEENKKLQDLIYKRDFAKLEKRIDRLEQDNYIFEELQIIGKGKSCKDVEITISKITENKSEYFLCTFYDISCFKESERTLLSKIQEEKQKTLTTVKGIIRNKQLIEKWHIAPSFFREIWKAKDEDSMLQKVIHLMCLHNGYKYASATILLKEEEYLQVKFANKTQPLQKFNIHKQHKLAQVFRGETGFYNPETGEFIVVITSPEEKEGVLQIFLDEKERAIIEDSESLWQSHLDFIECQAQFIGFMLSTLRNSFHLESQLLTSITILKEEIAKKIQAQEEFCIMQIRWDNFYECLIEHTDILENLRKELSKNILSLKPTSSHLFYAGEHDFFVLAPGNLLRSEGGESEKLRRKLSQATYIENIKLTVSIGIVRWHGSENENILGHSLQCIRASQKKGGNCVHVWENNKPVEVPHSITRKLQ